MENVHLFSQPISAHITQKNTLSLVECGLYAFDSLVNSALVTGKAGEVGLGS